MQLLKCLKTMRPASSPAGRIPNYFYFNPHSSYAITNSFSTSDFC